MLKIEKLNQFYGESHTLWDLDLDVPQGQCTCVMGRNGVGKTTLMKCIMGEETTKNGSIEFAGDVELTKKKVEDRSRLGIGYVPQGRQIFPLLTVEENLRTGLAVRKDGSKKIPERVYELFPVLKEMRHRRGGDLSGGQQQQLAIGRALAATEWHKAGLEPVTVSIGIAEYDVRWDESQLLRSADDALYRAKHAGRARCVIYEEPAVI